VPTREQVRELFDSARDAFARTTPEPARDAEPADDAVTVLARQHHELDEMVRGIERRPRTGPGPRPSRDIVELRRRFVVHEWSKHLHLWPVLRRAWPDGKALAGAAWRQKQYVEDRFIKLRWLGDRDPRAAGVLDELLDGIGEQVSLEQHILGRMRRTLPRQVLVQVGGKLTRREFLMPTRPHPYLPEQPWAALVFGLMTGAADRVFEALPFGPGGA
jgi:hypothetical protein